MRRVLLFTLLGLSCHVFSQNTINGLVKNEQGSPLVGANVIIEGSYSGDVTNENGEFELTNIKTGNYTLVISFIGYNEIKQELNINKDITLDLILNESSILSEEVVIKGVRAGEKSPVSQTTLQKTTIKSVYNGEHPVFFISDLTPSVVTESESGTSFANYGSMRLRGLDQHRINITLNGVPLNDMIDHGVYFSNFTDIGNSFESVQVQRGIGTSSNGVASFAGSINFESINLQSQNAGAEFQMGYGSYNSSRLNGQFNSGMINDKWSFHGSFNKLHSDGYKDNTETDAYSFFFSGGYFGEKHTFKLNAFDARSQNGLGYQAVDLETIKNNPTFNPLNENDKDNFGQHFVQLQHIYKPSTNLYWVSSLYVNGAGGDFPWGYLDENNILIQYNYPLTNKHYGIISNLHYYGIENLELNGGIHAYTFLRNNIEQVSPDFKNPYYDESSQKDEFSAFVKANYTFGKLTFFADLQLRIAQLNVLPDTAFLGITDDKALTETWNFLNPKGGIVFDIDKKTNVYASVGLMSREPRKTDILGGYGLYDIDTYNRLSNDIDFLHETVLDFEFGIKRQTSWYGTNINIFYMDFENGILESGETIEFGSKVRNNVPKSTRKGIELSFNAKLIENFEILIHSTYMKSEISSFRFSGDNFDTEDLTPILSPEVILNGSLGYNVHKNVRIDLTGKYVSESFMTLDNNSEFILPSFFLLNGRVSTKFLKKHSFSIEVNNLTSTEYYTNGSPVDTDGDWVDDAPGYFVNAPINFFGTLTLRF